MDYIICDIDLCFRFNEHIGRNIWPWHTFSVRMIEIKSSIWNENGLNQFYQLHKRSFLAVNRVVATFDWWTRYDFDFRKWKIRRFDAAFPIAITLFVNLLKWKKNLSRESNGSSIMEPIELPWRSLEVTDFDIK